MPFGGYLNSRFLNKSKTSKLSLSLSWAEAHFPPLSLHSPASPSSTRSHLGRPNRPPPYSFLFSFFSAVGSRSNALERVPLQTLSDLLSALLFPSNGRDRIPLHLFSLSPLSHSQVGPGCQELLQAPDRAARAPARPDRRRIFHPGRFLPSSFQINGAGSFSILFSNVSFPNPAGINA